MKSYNGKYIDSHQHVFWHGRDDQGLVDDMDEQGIDSAWLLSWDMHPTEDSGAYHNVLNPLHRRSDGTHAGIPLTDLLRARDRFPSRFMVGYCPHPLLGNAADLLRSAVEMYDIRVCGEWKFWMLFDDPRCIELFRVAGEFGLPVVLHLNVPYIQDAAGKPVYQPSWYGGTVENLARALQACPETNFIGHAPGFWREISAGAESDPKSYGDLPIRGPGRLEEMLVEYDNLYADLSAQSAMRALRRDTSYSAGLLNRLSGKFLFGRDFYGGELMKLLDSFNLDQSALKAICHDNAQFLTSRRAK